MRVDLDIFNETVVKLDNFIKIYTKNTKEQKSIVENIGSFWSGDDYEAFKEKWEELTSRNKSPEKIFGEQLQEFYNYIKFVYEEYISMQNRLQAMSRNLPQ